MEIRLESMPMAKFTLSAGKFQTLLFQLIPSTLP